ncbi:MAG: DUF502 domain-containing protein [Candidatus Dependentiae bacterium]|nr:DUF502 domain-containing protein [Candidatus Dependentiae bacterium]
MTSTNTSPFKRVSDTAKSLFISGLLTLLPLALTVTLFAFLFRTLKSWLRPLYNLFPPFLKSLPLSEIFVALIAILLVGIVLRMFLLREMVELVEHIFKKVPLLRQVYFGIKQLIHAFGPKDDAQFQRVVLVEFPRRGTYSVGFLTNENESPIAPQAADGERLHYLNVFVPHTPNPTTGFFILVPEGDCIRTDLSRQEAMTMIISGGIIQPERWKRTRP